MKGNLGSTGSDRLSNPRLPVAVPRRLAPWWIMNSMGTVLPSGRVWMASGKQVYRFVTRKIFRWRDREGAGDRV